MSTNALAPSDGAPARAGGRSQGKVRRITTECTYRIATGAWKPGQRLPSVREGSRLWSASEVTILRAYRELVRVGLVRSEERSGFYVRPGSRLNRITRHRREMERLYDRMVDELRGHGELSVLGTFRYLARLAEVRTTADPECVFVECTRYQAEMYAHQVSGHLEIPCAAVTTGDLATDYVFSDSVRAVLTTAFHYAEVAAAAPDWRVQTVPVQWKPQLTPAWLDGLQRLVIFCLDAEQGDLVARDVAVDLSLAGGVSVTALAETTGRIDDALAGFLGSPGDPSPGRSAMLSPSLWSAASADWTSCAKVVPYGYDIAAPGWNDIAAAVGLPLGTSG